MSDNTIPGKIQPSASAPGVDDTNRAIIRAERDHSLWALMSQTKDAIFKAAEKETRDYNITPEEGAVMFSIEAIGDCATAARIARLLIRERHSIAEQLNRMEKDGLVRKVKDMRRKNQWRAELTEKGRSIHKVSSKRESLHRIMSCLSEEEAETFRKTLHKLRNAALEDLGLESEIKHAPPGWDAYEEPQD